MFRFNETMNETAADNDMLWFSGKFPKFASLPNIYLSS